MTVGLLFSHSELTAKISNFDFISREILLIYHAFYVALGENLQNFPPNPQRIAFWIRPLFISASKNQYQQE